MGEFDDLFTQSYDLAGSDGHTFADGDTLLNREGQLLRIEGLEAAEIAKKTGLGIQPGTAGGAAATTTIMNLANQQGFKNVIYLTNPDGSPKMDATGTRQMVRLQDDQGRDFTVEATKTGVNQVGKYSSQNEVLAASLAEAEDKLDQPLTDWEKGALSIQQATNAEMMREQEFKDTALNERMLARLNAEQQPGESAAAYAARRKEAARYVDTNVQVRHLDRNLQNQALNPLSESFDVGLTGLAESMYGVAEMAGETTGWDWAQQIGEQGIARQRAYLQQMPQLKLSALKPTVDKDGNVTGNEWDIDGIGEFFEYLGNNAAVSLPYMAASMGGALLAPATGGTSLAAATGLGVARYAGASMLAPVAMYTGQTWNEMEGEKSAPLAIAAGVTQAVLDQLGIAAIVKGGSILKKGTLEAATTAFINKQAQAGVTISREAGRKVVENLTRKEIAKFAGAAAQTAKSQLAARNLLRAASTQAGKGLLGESATETLQELTGYMAAVAGSDKHFDAVELQNRLLNAAIAGGTLGAGFSIPGVAYDAGAWADVAVRQAPAEAKRKSRAGKRVADEERLYGQVRSIQQVNQQTAEDIDRRNRRGGSASNFSDKVAAANVSALNRDIFTRAKDAWAAIPGLWQGSTRFIFKDDLQDKYKALAELADTFQGNLQKVLSGSGFENRKKHLLTQYRNMVDSPAAFAQKAGFTTLNQGAISDIATKFGRWLGNQKGTPDFDRMPDELLQHRNWLSLWYTQVNNLSNKLYNDQVKATTDNNKKSNLGFVQNYLFKYKSFNKAAIEKDENGFIQKLMDNYNFTHAEAKELTTNILNQETLVGDSDTFTVGQGKFIPAAHRSRTLNLSENPEFDAFMETDAFTNLSNASKSAARYITYQEFLGDNNEKINEKLNQALEQGAPAEVVNKIAAQMQDYLDAESGNYKRIQNQTLVKIQKNLGIWTTVAGLPLATISSIVELMITVLGVPKQLIFKQIGSAAKEMSQAMWETITDPRWNGTNRQLAKEKRQAKIKELGYFDWDVGAAQTTGATENTHASRHLLDKYFKVIGLQQWTDYTRSIRASIADDYILNHLSIIQEQRTTGSLYTNEVQESEEHLRNIGINIDRLIELNSIQGRQWSEAEMKEFDEMMLEAQFNFVNMAIALPDTANRPLFYQNQHLALFTQFQGFISTFTANQIPRMWGEYVARGTPAVKYNVFAVMSTMLLMGFVSQYLKDLLKYGEPSPYLDDMEKYQRALGASGLMGTGERVVNFIYPIYESSSDNPAEWFFNTISGEAAALSNVSRVYGGAGKIIEGETSRGVYDLLKTAPLLGPFNQLNRTLASVFE